MGKGGTTIIGQGPQQGLFVGLIGGAGEEASGSIAAQIESPAHNVAAINDYIDA
jgi:hypothetical protein